MPQRYDKRQLSRMRQDAIRRTQEMYRRSAVSTSHYSQGREQKSPAEGDSSHTEEKIPVQLHNKTAGQKPSQDILHTASKNSFLKGLFSSSADGKIDTDKLMIIALIVILAREGADIKLILALAYILL